MNDSNHKTHNISCINRLISAVWKALPPHNNYNRLYKIEEWFIFAVAFEIVDSEIDLKSIFFFSPEVLYSYVF